MELILSVLSGAVAGLASVALWEGYFKPKQLRRALSILLSPEIAANLNHLENFRRYHKADPYASLTTLGPYNTVFLAILPDLWVLKQETAERVVDIYRRYAHAQHGIDLAAQIESKAEQAKDAGDLAKKAELLENRKQVLADFDRVVQPLIVEGEALLIELNREAFLRRRLGNRRVELGVDDMVRRLRDRRGGGDQPPS